MLEFLDGLLSGGKGRLPAVTEKLRRLADDQGIDLTTAATDIASGVRTALLLGARDILLAELLAIVRTDGIEEVLLQAAVSNLPVTPQGLARMLAQGGPGDATAVTGALARLESLSLLHRFPDGTVLVHRWTAQGLAALAPAEHLTRCTRAGRYRMWRAEHETHAPDDGVEALRNYLIDNPGRPVENFPLYCLIDHLDPFVQHKTGKRLGRTKKARIFVWSVVNAVDTVTEEAVGHGLKQLHYRIKGGGPIRL
jgi:hypothetical protein